MTFEFESEAKFEAHCESINSAIACMEAGQFAEALDLLDAALAAGESPNARWDRAQTLLALGRYQEGFTDYESRWDLFADRLLFDRGKQLSRDLPRWRGEELNGRHLVVIHEAGFGDTIMMLRFVAGLDVVLAMPPELERLAMTAAALVDGVGESDVACFTFDLPRLFGATLSGVRSMAGSYLSPDDQLRQKWASRLTNDRRERIGIAWSTTRNRPRGDIKIDRFLAALKPNGALLYSLQNHDRGAAAAHGIEAFAFEDFADVAALASLMDRIVSIDTAALHVAGAIGHQRTFAMLPHVPCWRWLNGSPWYPAIRVCRQVSPGDWESAFAQLSGD